MIIRLLLLENVQIWNLLIMLVYYFFIFFALGRIAQKRFNFNLRNINIAIPIGFVSFLFITFIFQMPVIVLNLNDFFFWTLDMLKEIIILIFIVIYYDDWLVRTEKPRNEDNFKSLFSSLMIIIFFTVIILFNIYFVGFNEVDFDLFSSFNKTSTTLTNNEYFLDVLTSKNLMTKEFYYSWFLFFIFSINIYLISQYWTESYVHNFFISRLLGFIMALFLINTLWINDTSNIFVFQIMILLFSISILRYYYGTWDKDGNVMLLFLLSISTLYTLSLSGIYYFIIFFIPIIIYQSYFRKDVSRFFIYGSYIFFTEIFLFLLVTNIVWAIIFAFIILIPLIPFTINYSTTNIENQNSNYSVDRSTKLSKEDEFEKTGGVIFSLIIFSMIFIFSFIFLNVARDPNGVLDHYSDYYSIYGLEQWLSILIIVVLFEIPVLFVLFFELLYFKKHSWYTVFSISYLLFLNPISIYAISNFWDINLDVLLFIWPIFLLDMIINLIPKYSIKVYDDIKIKNSKK